MRTPKAHPIDFWIYHFIYVYTQSYKNNKAGYTATLVACGWAGAEIVKVTGAFRQEQ